MRKMHGVYNSYSDVDVTCHTLGFTPSHSLLMSVYMLWLDLLEHYVGYTYTTDII